MVSKKKVESLTSLKKQMDEYPVVGILNMHKLPGRQLHEIRNKLRGQAVIRMVKKQVILRALQEKADALSPFVQGEPAMFFTKENPFRIARILQSSTSEASAKVGDISPKDILVPAGPTGLAPGPVIGEFQKAKIPAGVEGDKISIKKDTIVAKQGQAISQEVAAILEKLGIKPMEIGLNLVAMWESGLVYGKDVLFLPPGYYDEQIRVAVSHAFNLSVFVNYITAENIPYLLGKASREAEALAMSANIISPSSISKLLAKAHREAEALQKT